MYTIRRYHDISMGHRVVGHEHKCRFLHGHNYRIHFYCSTTTSIDSIGRVIDFGEVDTLLCQWLEHNWDHCTILWEKDPLLADLQKIDASVLAVPFNPTAENMARYLVEVIGPRQLKSREVRLYRVTIEETRKCSATYIANS